MKRKNIFNLSELKGKPGRFQDWIKIISPRLLFFLLGIASTIWFLVRVIPKPSRAGYPCMQATAPFMSGFVIYLISLGGITLAFRKARQNFLRARYIPAALFTVVVIIGLGISLIPNTPESYASSLVKTGPSDGANKPMGMGQGIYPGRVIWVWNPKATNADCLNVFDYYKPENTNQGVVNKMVVDAVTKLTGKTNLKESWDAIFQSFNRKKNKLDKGYTEGEKIFIKINQGTSNGKLKELDRKNGFYLSKTITESEEAKKGLTGICETNPGIVLEILRELIYVVGIDQKNIAIGDPISHIYGHNYEAWVSEFPNVVYVDRSTSDFGRTLIYPTDKELVYYSDKGQSDKLYDVIANANYMINVANLKPHGRAGITLMAKNHYGSHARISAYHLHYSLISPIVLGSPTNSGYGKYRALVDLMGSRYLGQNTLLNIVDGLYGGGSNETRAPVKYFMSPFNNDWSNSIFISQDQVALESVCYDFLRTEWNGSYKHNPANNEYESIPNINGVDDYLHQAADAANWPTGITYDPDNSGKPMASLGVHEHWNNAAKKQYSRNMGLSEGIELISIPDTLIGYGNSVITAPLPEQIYSSKVIENTGKQSKTLVNDSSPKHAISMFSVVNKPFGAAFQARNFRLITVGDDNMKWFQTELGIVSFDGQIWKIQDKNRKVPTENIKDFTYDFSDFGQELWIASPTGATVATLPVDAKSGATTYYKDNSTILSENVLAVTVGKNSIRWFGTDKGISAFRGSDWLPVSYQRKYPEELFRDFPITAMATSPDGDSLYAATEGAGVTRVYRNNVDAISGASEYAQWGPIEMPSDKVYSICITAGGKTQWFGTDMGAARHVGYKTLENWTVFDKDNGLIDNFVQAIAADRNGNVWFGTKNGLSVFDGRLWKSFTKKDGLPSNNIRCMKMDKEGVLWMGTDQGVISFFEGKFTCFN